STIGTPDYMAPEQVSGRRGDVRTDIYSLGVILYEMLTGHLPHSGPNVYNVMRAKTAEDPQPPSAFKPDLDPHLEEIILHAIERSPRDRYASAAEMLADLRDPSRVVPKGRAQNLHPRSLTLQRARRTAGYVLFFTSLIGIFVFLIWLANRYPASPTPPRRSYRGQVR
ncbi:MAG: protein kinase, partial [Candidatus Binatus sp.]